jgi:hypothetical protein
MEETQVKKMTITMKADGMIDKVEREKERFRIVEREIEGKYVATILYSHKSPGCWYYYLPNGECIEICF